MAWVYYKSTTIFEEICQVEYVFQYVKHASKSLHTIDCWFKKYLDVKGEPEKKFFDDERQIQNELVVFFPHFIGSVKFRKIGAMPLQKIWVDRNSMKRWRDWMPLYLWRSLHGLVYNGTYWLPHPRFNEGARRERVLMRLSLSLMAYATLEIAFLREWAQIPTLYK